MPIYLCSPKDHTSSSKGYPTVIVIQEIFGVNPHIRSVSERIAKEGYRTIAPDLFYRQGEHFESGYEDLKPGRARKAQLKDSEFLEDMDALLTTVKTPVASIGFCMGGTLSYLLATSRKLNAMIAFYGSGIASGPAQKTASLSCPSLLFYGGLDQSIPMSDIEKVKAMVNQYQKKAEIIVYPDADHGFFCDARNAYHPTAADKAWEKVKAFLASHLTNPI